MSQQQKDCYLNGFCEMCIVLPEHKMEKLIQVNEVAG